MVAISAMWCYAQKNIITITGNEGEKWEKTFTDDEAMNADSVIVKGFLSREIMAHQ